MLTPSPPRALPRTLTGRRSAWILILLSLLVTAGLLGTLRGADVVNDHGAAPVSSESAQVNDLLAQLPDADVQQLVVVVTREDGGQLAEQDLGGLGHLGEGRDAVGPHPQRGRPRRDAPGARHRG
ncbi:hypothetical protein [Ornithinimicrobium sp. Y1694]|uniref:hypothetical protein n=1 Tax=Ornithinimicrobium sp. Y1694 TaxID=3418590 RepID=UPI003CF446A9